jgi:integrase
VGRDVGAGLRKRDCKLLERKLHIAGTMVQVSGHTSRVEHAKTDGSIRVVPIPASVAQEIAAHLTAYPVASEDDLVFRAPEGGPLSRTTFRSRFCLPAVRKAGVTALPRFHDLRHAGVAMAIKQGAHPKVIQQWVGHAKITTTMDTYGHLYDGAEQELADGLDVLRAEALAAPPAKVVQLR